MWKRNTPALQGMGGRGKRGTTIEGRRRSSGKKQRSMEDAGNPNGRQRFGFGVELCEGLGEV